MGSCCSKRGDRGERVKERELKVRPPRRSRKQGPDSQHVLSGSAGSESSGRASARSQKPGSTGPNGRLSGAVSFTQDYALGVDKRRPEGGRGEAPGTSGRGPEVVLGRQLAGDVQSAWPPWLSSVAGDAIVGWVPRRADSFEKLDKVGSQRPCITQCVRNAGAASLSANRPLKQLCHLAWLGVVWQCV
jgi:hypothetical protein